MFTGIITGVGRIAALEPLGSSTAHGKRLRINTPGKYLDGVHLGDSIAINGACMTVTSFDCAQDCFTVDVSAESLAKTAGLDRTGPVNLEQALRASDRLGGHLVSGHVDGVGVVSFFAPVGESWELRLAVPQTLAKFLAYKGSITVNGVSLTVNRVIDSSGSNDQSATLIHAASAARVDVNGAPLQEQNRAAPDPSNDATTTAQQTCEISINLIPHTVTHTALGSLVAGQHVNLEIDLIARYVERMMSAGIAPNPVATPVNNFAPDLALNSPP